MGCHRLPETFHGKEGVVVALALPSEIHSRAGPRGSRPHRALFAIWATAHPALIPHEAPGNPRPHPRIPATMRAQALLTRQIPAYPRSGRKHHDRPVTPEVAGSSPVAPVNSLQIGIFSHRIGHERPPASFHPVLIPHRKLPTSPGCSR